MSGSGDNSELVAQFYKWLKENGARFDKIEWPSSNTISGVRGAIALSKIETNETMIEIPKHLMMCPPTIFQDPLVGQKLQSSLDILQGDLLLAVYIMYEINKKEHSFFYPFLRILPEPGNISEWSAKELNSLQVCNIPPLIIHSFLIK